MLQRIREGLSLVLLVLLPFHALAVTALTKFFVGAGHAPLPGIAFWKEAILAVILLIAFLEYVRALIMTTSRRAAVRHFDVLDGCAAVFALLAFLISDFLPPVSILPFAIGLKYDVLPIIIFLVLRRVPWSTHFRTHAVTALLWVAGIVSLYGIATLFLPDSFFSWLGYSDLHSLYLHDGPLAAFQQIGGSSLHRIQSTFSGPNQFGIWLLIPIGIVMSHELGALRLHHLPIVTRIIFAITLVALLLTFSRAAWIGAFVIIVIGLMPCVKSRLSRAWILGLAFAFIALVFTAIALFPNALLRISSTRGHIQRPIEAVQTMIANPLGLGLGTAGPATNRSGDTCVMLRPEDDPAWAKEHPNLCVFLGDVQVQPTGRACNCPFLPENWYLQIGVELGWLGFIIYVLLTGLILWKLRTSVIAYRLSGVFSLFLGISIAALFLHAWEDSAVAYTGWLMVAVVLSIF